MKLIAHGEKKKFERNKENLKKKKTFTSFSPILLTFKTFCPGAVKP